MPEKAFVTENNMATFTCPNCNFSNTADISTYKDINKEVRMNVKCMCGHYFSVMLERRASYRKDVELKGTYTHRSSKGEIEKGSLFVNNISRSGLRFNVKVEPTFSEGDKIFLEFQLDDKPQALIKKEVVIKSIFKHKIIGSKFCSVSPSDPNDKAIGFYLFQ